MLDETEDFLIEIRTHRKAGCDSKVYSSLLTSEAIVLGLREVAAAILAAANLLKRG